MHCHFLLQIEQANGSMLPDGLCAHSHIPTLHILYSYRHPEVPKEAQPRWWVSGRSLERSQRLSPGTSPPLTPQLSSGALPRFTSITLESQCPHLAPTKFQGLQWHVGPGSPRRTHLQDLGSSGPDAALKVRDLPPKAWADSLPIRIPGPSSFLSPDIPMNWCRVGIPCPPVVPSLPCTSGRGREAQTGWKACLQLWTPSRPYPRPVQVRRPQGPRGQTGCGPWRVPPPLGVPPAVDLQQGAAPPWTWLYCLQGGLRRHLSPDLRSQFFLFLPGLTSCSRGWDPGSRPESAPDSVAPNRT